MLIDFQRVVASWFRQSFDQIESDFNICSYISLNICSFQSFNFHSFLYDESKRRNRNVILAMINFILHVNIYFTVGPAQVYNIYI